jgi:hypothetical protein
MDDVKKRAGMRWVLTSASDVLHLVPAFLARIPNNLHTLLEEILEILGPLLHLILKPSHYYPLRDDAKKPFRERKKVINFLYIETDRD